MTCMRRRGEELVVSIKYVRLCIFAAISLTSGSDNFPVATICDTILMPGLGIDVVDAVSMTP